MTEDEEGTQAMTIRLPKQRHEWLRRTAFERRTTMNDLVNEAIQGFFFGPRIINQDTGEEISR